MNLLKSAFILLVIASLGFSVTSCKDDLFGNKTDLGFIDIPDTTPRAVAYVPVLPVIDGGTRKFQEPVHIAPGFDRFFYVVDSVQGIFALDETGRQVGFLPNPDSVFFTSVSQDRTLDLLAVGRKLHKIPGQNRVLSLPIIYRYTLKDTVNESVSLSLNQARIVSRMIYPYFLSEDTRVNDPNIEKISFGQVGFISGNRFYVTIKSPNRTPGGFTFENNAVLLCFSPKNETKVSAWTQIQITTSNGVSSQYFLQPNALVSLLQPPQNFRLPEGNSEDFIVTQVDPNPNIPTRTLWISVSPSTDGPPTYSFRNLVPPANNRRYLYTPFRFKNPQALAYAGDGRRQLWVLDSDSVYLFSNLGVEGTRPARGTANQDLVPVSFGGTGTSLSQFNRARSICYMNNVIWVVDQGNKRILRFKLTTDID